MFVLCAHVGIHFFFFGLLSGLLFFGRPISCESTTHFNFLVVGIMNFIFAIRTRSLYAYELYKFIFRYLIFVLALAHTHSQSHSLPIRFTSVNLVHSSLLTTVWSSLRAISFHFYCTLNSFVCSKLYYGCVICLRFCSIFICPDQTALVEIEKRKEDVNNARTHSHRQRTYMRVETWTWIE